jgi:uncharacterized membrane protein YphA (DoxX/SURF4 family)
LKAQWTAELSRTSSHYRFTADQRKQADEALKSALATADQWFLNTENAQKIQKYKDDLSGIEKVERDPAALEYQRSLAYKERKELDSTRRELLQPIDAWTTSLRESWTKLATPEQQRRAAGPPSTPSTQLDLVNAVTKYSMVAIGVGLLLGLFTRLSALSAAAYLTMFYLSMPPWPGLPASPMAEGHYVIVNKNLIELLACLVLATTRTGLWIGIDALLFGARARRRDAAAAARDIARNGDLDTDSPQTHRQRYLTGRDR